MLFRFDAFLPTPDQSIAGAGDDMGIKSMTPETTRRHLDGTFTPGQSGNPSGRPKGARHKTTLAVQALMDGQAEEITRKAIEAAKSGDMTAIRLVLERVLPARKDNPVMFDLPEITSAGDAAKAMGAIMAAVAGGKITPSEGGEAAKLMGVYIEALKTAELEKRIKQLEEGKK